MDFNNGLSTPDGFENIDYLLDFSTDDPFTSSASSTSTISHDFHRLLPHSLHSSAAAATSNYYFNIPNPDYSTADFTDHLCIPDDDIAELEWLSNFVDDSSVEFPPNSVTGVMNSFVSEKTSDSGRSRSKRSRSTTAWTTTAAAQAATPDLNLKIANSRKREQSSKFIGSSEKSASPMETVPRKCTHCASETTPQWRTGPLGPKTLCNACGVRYKSGRLVPEYRPAASPTFVLTQHSNSHRKVLELRRQKELVRQQEQQQQQEVYGHRTRHFQVC